MQAEQLLVQKIASRPSTEDLIFFIAQDDAITSACSELQRKIAGNSRKDLKELNSLCQRHHISLAYLTRELHHIQSIFAPKKNISDDHKLLGLEAQADITEVKQAYRRLSIKYHPDTSNKNNTAKFIEITKAYQRILAGAADNKEKNTPPSPSAWRYRKNTPPPHQQRKKKYIYLLSFITGILVLAIVAISIHYQKRAMLKNITKISRSPSPAAAPIEKIEKISAIVRNQAAETEDVSVPSRPAVQQHEMIKSEPSFQKKHPQINHDQRGITPLTPEHMTYIPPVHPEMSTEVEEKNFSRSISFADNHADSEESEESFTQKSDQAEGKSSVPAKENKDLFSDILEQDLEKNIVQKKPAEEKVKAAAAPVAAMQPPSTRQETGSVFIDARYHKALVVRPKERKVRQKKSPATDAEQTPRKMHQDISEPDSLRAFIQSYTATYRSRDIAGFALFFTEAGQENGVPFSEALHKYKKLFSATRAIDYSIELLGTDIQEKGTALTGRFHVQLTYSPDDIRSNTGTITFFLVKENGQYKIKAITYHLDPKW